MTITTSPFPPNATVPTVAAAQPATVTLQHPHADPGHPAHGAFIGKLVAGVLGTGLSVAVYVGTAGTVRIGPLTDRHFDIETGGLVKD